MVVLTTSRKPLLDTVALPESPYPGECLEEARPLSPMLPTAVGFYALAAVLVAATWRLKAPRRPLLRRSRRHRYR